MGGRARGRARRARPRRAGSLRGGGRGRDRPRRDRRRPAAERRPGAVVRAHRAFRARRLLGRGLARRWRPLRRHRAEPRLSGDRPGEPFEELEALQRIPSRENWSFPPRPWTHHVRWIAPSPYDPERLLAGIELGGVMLSADGGRSFTDHRPGAVADAHQLAWHPTAADRAYEVGGGGAAWSIDGGESWEQDAGGLEVTYCWTLAVSPSDPDLWWIAAAPGPMQAHRARRRRRPPLPAVGRRLGAARGAARRDALRPRRYGRRHLPRHPRRAPAGQRGRRRAGPSSVPSSGRYRPSPRFREGRRRPPPSLHGFYSDVCFRWVRSPVAKEQHDGQKELQTFAQSIAWNEGAFIRQFGSLSRRRHVGNGIRRDLPRDSAGRGSPRCLRWLCSQGVQEPSAPRRSSCWV